MITILIVLVILVAFSGLFSGSEIAFFSLSPARIQTLVNEGRRGARRALRLREEPQKLLAAILLGNNLANIAGASLATMLAFRFVGDAAVGVATGVMTVVILIFGEIIPKSFSVKHAERIVLWMAPLLLPMVRVVRPLSWMLEHVTPHGKEMIPSVTEEELRIMTTMGVKEGTVESDEAQLIHNVFRLNDVSAADVMTPRSRMTTLTATTMLQEARDTIVESQFSRIPLFGKNHETVVGILYKNDALVHLASEKPDTVSLQSLARPVLFVPDTKSADDFIRELQDRHVHMAIIVNEHGDTVGLVTLEDLLEELVKEIIDERDIAPDHMRRVAKNEVHAAGATEVRHINDFFNSNLDESFTTIAGLLAGRLGRVPVVGDVVEEMDCRIEVVEADATSVRRVHIKKTKTADNEQET